jgi:Tat protein translocase TatB subunit
MSSILLFFNISTGEIVFILFIALMVFGPSRFPELARKIGKGINEIKRASESIKKEINQEVKKVDQKAKEEQPNKDSIKSPEEDQ